MAIAVITGRAAIWAIAVLLHIFISLCFQLDVYILIYYFVVIEKKDETLREHVKV